MSCEQSKDTLATQVGPRPRLVECQQLVIEDCQLTGRGWLQSLHFCRIYHENVKSFLHWDPRMLTNEHTCGNVPGNLEI